MITYIRGDLFTSPASVLVNTVNTVGVMGKGIAKDFKRFYPEMFREYQRRCEQGTLDIGELFFYQHPHKSVLNFPTKKHWRQPSRLDYIEAGLSKFVQEYRNFRIHSVGFPQLGCGNGELDWENQVRPLMQDYLGPLPILVYIHLYDEAKLIPEHRDVQWMKDWLRTEPENLAVSEAWEDLKLLVLREELKHSSDWGIYLDIDSEHEIDGQGTLEDNLEQIVFENGMHRVALRRDDFARIWNQLRDLGVIALDELPGQLSDTKAPIGKLLTQLSYLEPVEFSFARVSDLAQFSPTEANETPVRGIKLIPRPAYAQRELLTI